MLLIFLAGGLCPHGDTIEVLQNNYGERQKPITDRILEFLRCSPECDFEALVTRYPEFTWNELYLEVARLSRMGQVKITRGVGLFTIKQAAVIP